MGGMGRKFDSQHNIRLLHYAGFFPWTWFDAKNVYLIFCLGSTSVLVYDSFLILMYVIFLWHNLTSGIAVFLPAEVVQWLRLARSKGPIWVGVSPPSPEDGRRTTFRNVVILYVYILSGRWTKSRRQLVLHARVSFAKAKHVLLGPYNAPFRSVHTRRWVLQ
jgi:hypothetical protein